MYVPTGLKTVDGKDIMGFNGAFYLQNKEKINKMLKKYEEIIAEEKEKKFRTSEFNNIEADVVYKIKSKNAFILIEHQSSVDIKMPYRILRYKCAIIESAIDKKR